MAETIYGIMIKAKSEGKKIICNATADTSLINIKNMLKRGISEIFDMKGRKIILGENGNLVYETGKELEYRRFSEESEIDILELEIRPNLEKMVEARIKIKDRLDTIRRKERMKGKEKTGDSEEPKFR